jgi:hypothetical protein
MNKEEPGKSLGKKIRKAQREERKKRTDRRNARGDCRKLDLP